MNALRWLLRLVAAGGLGIDVYVHWHLAHDYDSLTGPGSPHVSQGQLFRVEAGLALVALVLVLLVRHRWAGLSALLVAGGGAAVVVLYQYLNVGAFGPVPNMYEPGWYTEKTLSVVAEAIGALAALIYLLLPTRAEVSGGSHRENHALVAGGG